MANLNETALGLSAAQIEVPKRFKLGNGITSGSLKCQCIVNCHIF